MLFQVLWQFSPGPEGTPFLCMRGVCDSAGPRRACDGARRVVVFRIA